MHYFSPNVTIKPDELTSSLATDDVPRDVVETAVQSVTKRPRTAKINTVVVDDDDDFENDTILTPRNSITKYFSPVDRQAVTRKHKKPCIMTVQVQVHGSPQKKGCKAPASVKKVQRKKKRKIGIPSALADTIELVSSEELMTESSPSPEVMVDIKNADPVQPQTPKSKWKMKICLSGNVKVSDGNDDSLVVNALHVIEICTDESEALRGLPREVDCNEV